MAVGFGGGGEGSCRRGSSVVRTKVEDRRRRKVSPLGDKVAPPLMNLRHAEEGSAESGGAVPTECGEQRQQMRNRRVDRPLEGAPRARGGAAWARV